MTLSFERISYINLINGKKYLIKIKPHIKGEWSQYIGTFDKIEENEIKFLRVKTNISIRPKIAIHKTEPYNYFTLNSQKEQIQNAMELRAINKVLKRLIDESFVY